jgi:putative hydrolase of the HAD superfamily
MVNEVELGKAIQNARKGAGLTQQELCQQANLSYSTLAKIERGAIRTPSVFTVASIAARTGTTVEGLLGLAGARFGGVVAAEKAYKTAKNGVSFVYFDINGVQIRFFHRAFSKISEVSGMTPDKIESVFWHYNDAVCRGEMSVEEFNSILSQQLRIPDFDWKTYYIESVDPIPEVHEVITWAAEHYRVGLLSNIFPGFIDALLKAGLLPDVPYAAVIDSSEVGAIKPEEQIYRAAQAIADVPGDQILFVDDSRSNLMGAERLGWHVLWFDDFRPEESVNRIRSALEF